MKLHTASEVISLARRLENDSAEFYKRLSGQANLNGCIVDYVETLEGAGFKFENPNVKSS